MDDFLVAIGVNAKILIAGFAGGVVKALYDKSKSPVDVLSSVIGGALTANYVAGVAIKWSGLNGITEGFAGFAVGVGGMLIVQGILGAIRARVNSTSTSVPKP